MPSSASTASAQGPGGNIVPQTVLRLGPQFRRCCWYLFVGSWLMVGAVLLIRQQAGHPPLGAAMDFVAVLALPASMLLLVLTAESWRMRIDADGISRRRWWFWSTWPWVAFRAGRISRSLQNGRYVYFHPDRPWGDRRLHVDWLADGDRALVDQLCRQALSCVGNSSAIPTEIVADGRGRFTNEGIRLSFPWERKPQSPVPWSDVEKLQLRWCLAENGLCCRVELQAQGSKPKWALLRQLEAIAPGGERLPLANELEQVEQFIAPRLEPERFASYQVFDSPRTATEAAHQIEYFRRRLQSARWCYLILNAFGLAAAVGLFVGKIVPGARILWAEPFLAWPWKVAILACSTLIILTVPVLLMGLAWLTFRELHQRIARAKAMLVASA